MDYQIVDTIYENKLASADDIAGWQMEGDGAISFPMGRMRMEGTRAVEDGQKANIVHWCPEQLPDFIRVCWDFYPIREPGLAILFFGAVGRNGDDVLSPALDDRSGPYNQYHHGDINALHVSYFRRKHPGERAFTTCNLRKSYGFHLVAQGPDPIPSVPDATPPYTIELIKAGPHVVFSIGQGERKVECFSWTDDGERYGPVLDAGKIGFRQMTPLIAEYADLTIERIEVDS